MPAGGYLARPDAFCARAGILCLEGEAGGGALRYGRGAGSAASSEDPSSSMIARDECTVLAGNSR